LGHSFTISASVYPPNVTGTITFLNAGSAIAGCTNLTASAGSTGCIFSNWAVNLSGYRLSAVFNGDATHHWSYSNDVTQVVYDPASSTLDYEGLWWSSPAGSESGWGINIAHQGDIIFATWFTYDMNGKAWWLSMTAPKIGANAYAGTLFQTTGPAFSSVPFNPASVLRTPVGSASLTFTDANTAQFAYTVNGVMQAKTLTRQVFGILPACTFGAQPNLALATNYQDLWWASPAGSESGWGINLTEQSNVIFGTWFTYDLDGSPLWLSVTATNTAAGVFMGTLFRTTGPPFDAMPFDPAKVVRTPVGTATFTFSDGNNATFAYTVNGISQAKAITRQVFVAPGTVCH
jgi:hypothetical protein